MIRYITLVKIPDSHEVALFFDWAEKFIQYEFMPLKDIPQEKKQRLKEWEDSRVFPVGNDEIIYKWIEEKYPDYYELDVMKQLGIYLSYSAFAKEKGHSKWEIEPGGPYPCPEIVLGESLSLSCIKWTKDVRLLYQGDKRKQT